MSSTKSQSKTTPPKPGLWQRIGPGAFAEARFNPYRIGAVALALALAIGAATYLGNRTSGSDDTTATPGASSTGAPTASTTPSPGPAPSLSPAAQYRSDVNADFTGISGVTLNYQQILIAWDKGVPTDAVLAGTFQLVHARGVEVRDLLAKRAPFAAAPRVLVDYQVSAQLYLESARVGESAVLVPKGPLRDQLRHQVSRLRELADRTFDQAVAELVAQDPVVPQEGIDPAQPIEVPDFSFEKVAAGPPLDTAPAAPAEPRRAIKDKAQQPFSSWAAAVGAATPSAAEVASAIRTGTTTQLQAISRRLSAASDTLFTTPDPQGEHFTATQVELGRLIEAEGTRAAQIATLLPGVTQSALSTTAQRLVVVGDQLWDNRLGVRSSRFPASLLSDK